MPILLICKPKGGAEGNKHKNSQPYYDKARNHQ